MSDMHDYKKLLTMDGRVLPAVALQLLKDRDARDSARDTDNIHPSSLSKRDWCIRENWYTIKKQQKDAESFSFQRLNVFAEGHNIHAKWQGWLYNAGILEGMWQCSNPTCSHKWYDVSPMVCPTCHNPKPHYREVPIENHEYRIQGHADGIISDKEGKAIVEIKSVGLGTIRFEAPDLYKQYQNKEITIDGLWKKIRQPFSAHVKQGLLYMYCTGITDAVILYEWKPTQEVKEFSIKFNQDLVQPMLDNCTRLMSALETTIPPMRPMWAEEPTSYGCKFCSYRNTCWRLDDEPGDGTVSTGLRSPVKAKRTVTRTTKKHR